MGDGRFAESLNYLLERWLAGDQQAAATLWHRHARRLIGLARKTLSPELARDCDPEDVVQSVYLKFFAAARSSVLALKTGEDLWRLLVAITRNKIRDQYKRRQAQKRQSGAKENPEFDLTVLRDRQPMPGEQAALADEVNRLIGAFKPHYRPIVALRLDGWKLDEIARATKHHERTVRRVLKRVQANLRQRCADLRE
jgi:RNA polymerase sigma factor (sigma-70 family)